MAGAKPWFTSTDLIASVKRKISFPISQNTFSELDILAFANEEMAISQVPSVLEFHEEYFVFKQIVPLQFQQSRYPIPERALGMRLRDLKWVDRNNNLFDMTRVAAEDKAFYQRNIGTSETLSKYYLEGNDIVLLPEVLARDAVSLVFYYFLRPNQLVLNNRAATILNFINTVTISNNTLVSGDNVNIAAQIFTATNGISISGNTAASPTVITTAVAHGLVTGQSITISGNTTSTPAINGTFSATVLSPTTFSIPVTVSGAGTDGVFVLTNSQFLIAASDVQTATNLSNAINNNGVIVSANNGSPSTSIVTLRFSNLNDCQTITTSNSTALTLPIDTQTIEFDQVPTTYTDPITFQVSSLYTDGSTVDFLQTKPGHQTRGIDILIPKNGISNTFIGFNLEDVPSNTILGDYICLSNECIIPQIPPDLHNGLAERTCSRILASLGDQAGLQTSMQKIQEIEKRQSTLLDNRVESSPLKITARHSILRYQGFGSRRRRL